jgi:hypothetical protein
MSGLIILFWFLEGGVALRFLVSILSSPGVYIVHTRVVGVVRWCYVVLVRPLGCHR